MSQQGHSPEMLAMMQKFGASPRQALQPEPFVWGKGGRRMTPQDISREREIAASLMQADYSPIQSPWQGLARVAGNITGALRERSAMKAQDANSAASQQIMQSLLGGGDPASTGVPAPEIDLSAGWTVPVDGSPMGNPPPGASSPAPGGGINPAILQALADPYLDPQVKQIAMQQYKQATEQMEPMEINGKLVNPRTFEVIADYSSTPEIVQIAKAAGYDPATPAGQAFLKKYADSRADPEIVIPLANGTYVGPRSGVRDAVGGAAPQFAGWPDEKGGPASQAPGGF